MDTPRNESNVNMNIEARKLHSKASRRFEAEIERGKLLSKVFIDPSQTRRYFSQLDSERDQQHLISCVVFRLIRESGGDDWELENVWDGVNLSQLDDIQTSENFDYYEDYHDNIKIAMVENPNIVLWRGVRDWSREDGNVLSNQIIWSGSFVDCQRLVELFDHNTPSIDFRIEEYDLHPQLRDQFLYRHQAHPVAAAMAAFSFSQTLIISDEQLDTGDDEGFLCAICHDRIPVGFPTTQLPCKHIFHAQCIAKWFYNQVTCPLCRDKPS